MKDTKKAHARTRLTMALAFVAVLLPLAGCTQEPAPAVSPSPTTSADHMTLQTAPPPQHAEDGVQTAEAVMSAFVDRNRSYDEWWADVSQYLTATAYQAYEYTDPARVTASEVTGDGIVSATPSYNRMTVLVPTDVGQYTVELIRQSETPDVVPPWFVEAILPPEGQA